MNAINMIDGLHGVASGVCVILLAAIGVIAADLGDAVLRDFCGVVTAATLGFFVAWASVLLNILSKPVQLSIEPGSLRWAA